MKGFKLLLFRAGTLLLTPFVFITFFVSLPIFIFPFLLYRLLVERFAPILKPKLGKMVTAPGAICYGENFYDCPKASIVNQGRHDGVFEVQELVNILRTSVLPAKHATGELKYPELMQYIVSWGGYLFFKKKEDFDLTQHVFEVEKIMEGEEELDHFHLQLQQKPWKRKMPLWEFHLAKYREEKDGPLTTVIYLRTHHILADGYSLVNLVVQYLYTVESLENITGTDRKFSKTSILSHIRTFLFYLSLPFRLGWEGAEVFLYPLVNSPLPFKATEKKRKRLLGDYVVIAKTGKVSLKVIKDVKNKFGTSFAAVQTAGISAGLKEAMKKLEDKERVIQGFPMFMMLPLPKGQRDSLRNYWGAGLLHLPTGDDYTPFQRLKKCDSELKAIRTSAFTFFAFFFLRVLGTFPFTLYKSLLGNPFTTGGLTTFPMAIGKSRMSIAGIHLNEVYFTIGTIKGPTGIVFTLMSFGDFVRFCAVGDASVFSKDDLNEVCSRIEKELFILQHLSKEENV